MSEEVDFEEFEETTKRALIDGDVLIHMACWQKPLNKKEKAALEAEIETLRDFNPKDPRIPQLETKLEEGQLTYQPTIEKAQERFRHFMKHTLDCTYSEEYSIAIGDSKSNWRLDIHPEYKLQKARTNTNDKRAPYIQDLRMWAVEEYSAHYCQGYEADDAIRTWATRLGEGNYIVCSVDKDLNLIPGHHFDPKTQDPEKRFWYMDPVKSAMFFWEQMLTGDSIDNIPGIRGIGPKKAEQILAGCETEQECKEAVVQQYDLKYGEEGYDQLLFNGQLLHIWRWKGDNWTFDEEEYEAITGTKPPTRG